jgi:hypothetical protein
MAGALFANGATDLRNAAAQAGLSVATLSNIIKNNSDSMYYSGMNIGQASKKISSAFAAGGDSFKKTLFNLGYSAEEQGALVAESMKYMSVAGMNVKNMSGGDVANATREYAINLKSIAAITGDDAKKRMEQAREASANAAVQFKLSQMDPAARKQFEADLATIPKELQTAALQMFAGLPVVDRAANVMFSMIPGLEQNFNGMVNSLGKGQAAMGQYREAVAENVRAAHASGQTQAIGMAGLAGIPGVAGDVSKAMGTLTLDLQRGAKQTGDTADALATLERMANTVDPLTKSMSLLQIQTEELKSQLENVVMNILPQFGDVLAMVNEQMIKMLQEADAYIKTLQGKDTVGGDKPKPEADAMGKIGEAADKGSIYGAIAGGIIGAIKGAFFGTAVGPLGTIGGALGGAATGAATGYGVGGATYGVVEAIKQLFVSRESKAAGKSESSVMDSIMGWFNSNTAKNARGGITQAGKLNIAGEAGPEAIVPLESGAIPVSIRMLQNGDTGGADRQSITPEEIANLYGKFAVSVSDLSSSLKLTDTVSEKLYSSLTDSSEGIVNTTIQAAQDLHNSFVGELSLFTKAVGTTNDMLLKNFSGTEEYVNSILQKFNTEARKDFSADTPTARQQKLSIEVDNKDNANESFDVEGFVNRLAIINEKQRIELVSAIKDLTGSDRVYATDAAEYKKIIDDAGANFLRNLAGTEDYVDSITQKFVTDSNRESLNTISGMESSIGDIARKMTDESNGSFERNLSQSGDYFAGLTRQFVGQADNLIKNLTGTETNVGTTVQKFLSDASNSFIDGLSSTKNFVGGLVQSIGDIGVIKQIVNSQTNDNAAIVRKEAEAAPATANLMSTNRPDRLGEVLSSYFELKVNEIRPDREMMSDLKDELGTRLTELATEIRNNSTESKNRLNENTNQFGRSDYSVISDSLNASSKDLKDTIMLQNKLLEENIQLSRELISVANDTRNYSQAIAQNTL